MGVAEGCQPPRAYPGQTANQFLVLAGFIPATLPRHGAKGSRPWGANRHRFLKPYIGVPAADVSALRATLGTRPASSG